MARLISSRGIFFRTFSGAFLAAALAATAGMNALVSADPLPGEQLKFFQSPLDDALPGIYPVGATPLPTDNPAPFPGQDVNSTLFSTTAGGVQGNIVADDFSDFNPLPIGHVTFWGSYLGDTNLSGAPLVPAFQISLYTDVPAAAGTNADFSHPGTLIATQTVTAGALSPSSGTFTAQPIPPGASKVPPPAGESGLIEYNAELNWKQIPFPDAVNGNVEWISIAALLPPTASVEWGWHDRDYGIADPFAGPTPNGGETPYPYHFLDDAVTAADNNGVIGGYAPQLYNPNFDGIGSSMDMAFALYTVPVPEPATIGVLGLVIPALMMRRRKQH